MEKEINEDLLKRYTDIKIRLRELKEQEGKLREQLLNELTLINKDEYETDYIKIFKIIQKRIFYPKAELEKQIPEDLLSKIRQEKEILCLMSKIKKTASSNNILSNTPSINIKNENKP